MSGSAVTLDRTLGELVAERPARARILEAAGIDYCCHGQRSLGDAATAAGLDATALVTDLSAVSDTAGVEVDTLEPGALVSHIVSTHHAYLHAELPALRALADKVNSVHGGRHAELAEVARLVEALEADMEPHMAKEEAVLFPAITRLFSEGGDGASLAAPVGAMTAEHEGAGELLEQLRTVTRDYAVPADGCASYQSLYGRLAELESDTFRHVHLENNVLFPQVLASA
jgi:regulator of cell morphogenesis and NO signaling